MLVNSKEKARSGTCWQKLNDLRALVNDTAPAIGALVSVDTLICLGEPQIVLNKNARADADELGSRMQAVRAAINPTNSMDGPRSRWGLLMLLRDEIESNALAASALLT